MRSGDKAQTLLEVFCGRRVALHDRLQLVAGVEGHDVAGLDRDRLAGARVAARARRLAPDVEVAEARQLDVVAVDQASRRSGRRRPRPCPSTRACSGPGARTAVRPARPWSASASPATAAGRGGAGWRCRGHGVVLGGSCRAGARRARSPSAARTAATTRVDALVGQRARRRRSSSRRTRQAALAGGDVGAARLRRLVDVEQRRAAHAARRRPRDGGRSARRG